MGNSSGPEELEAQTPPFIMPQKTSEVALKSCETCPSKIQDTRYTLLITAVREPRTDQSNDPTKVPLVKQ